MMPRFTTLMLRRSLRDRNSRFHLVALFILIVTGVYFVVSVLGASYSIIDGTQRLDESHRTEDGYFDTYMPLTEAELKPLEDLGVEFERHFSLDFELADQSILRLERLREQIDRAWIMDGELPKNGEILLEYNYARERNLHVSDSYEISGRSYRIAGLMVLPDYDCCLQEISDVNADASAFGLALLSPEDYDKLDPKQALRAERYSYSYLLHSVEAERFKKEVMKLEIDLEDVSEPALEAYVEEKMADIDKILDASHELETGGLDFTDGVEKLQKGSEDLKKALERLPEIFGIFPDANEYFDGVKDLADGSEEYRDGLRRLHGELEDATNELRPKTIPNIAAFVPRDHNPRIHGAKIDAEIDSSMTLIIGIFVFFLCTYVIMNVLKSQIEKERPMIGTLLALGVRQRELIQAYLTPMILLTFVAGLCGYIASLIYGIEWSSSSTRSYFSIPHYPPSLNFGLILYSCVALPILTLLAGYDQLRRSFEKDPLDLIRNTQEQRIGRVKISSKYRSFFSLMQGRQLKAEFSSALLVLGGILLSLFLLHICVMSMMLTGGIRDVPGQELRYDLMYVLKFPTTQPPEGGEAALVQSVERDFQGNRMDITMIGIDDSQFFPSFKVESSSEIAVSASLAAKFNVEVGDEISFVDSIRDRYYAFRVSDIVPYHVGMTAFMPVKHMEKLLGEPKGSRNVIFSNQALDIPNERLTATVHKEDLIKAGVIFYNLMKNFYYILTGSSMLLSSVVLIQMLKIMIHRSTRSISLFKIFGFRKRELRRLFLDGQVIFILIGLIPLLPLTKWMMDILYPQMVANVAWGCKMVYSWQLYLLIYAGFVAIIFPTLLYLQHKIKQISVQEVLQERE
ncbi:MAG: FtsX-like permease family protein [Eubacteriales bacterium]|nr:FtsX-like permease family protein [Eubacteriales bacterium]